MHSFCLSDVYARFRGSDLLLSSIESQNVLAKRVMVWYFLALPAGSTSAGLGVSLHRRLSTSVCSMTKSVYKIPAQTTFWHSLIRQT